MNVCQICERAFTTASGLGLHIWEGHHIRPQQYYNTFFGEGKCLKCGNTSSFKSIKVGYGPYCGYVCRGKATQDLLKAKPNDSERRRQLVAQREAKWQETGIPEGTTRSRQNVSKMLPERRAVVNQKALEAYRSASFLRSYTKLITQIPDKFKRKALKEDCIKPTRYREQEDFGRYCRRVRYWTKKAYRHYKYILNPHNYKLGSEPHTYQIDHIVSLKDCYHAGLPEQVAGCSINLQVISQPENSKKGDISSKPISWLLQEWATRRYELKELIDGRFTRQIDFGPGQGKATSRRDQTHDSAVEKLDEEQNIPSFPDS